MIMLCIQTTQPLLNKCFQQGSAISVHVLLQSPNIYVRKLFTSRTSGECPFHYNEWRLLSKGLKAQLQELEKFHPCSRVKWAIEQQLPGI